MSDLTTRYMGLTLKSPLVASASPLCESAENIGKLEDQGIAAVVLPSLFEEQLVLESLRVDADLERGSDSFPESLNFFPDLHTYNLGPDGYLELIRSAKARVSIPVIASLNFGCSMLRPRAPTGTRQSPSSSDSIPRKSPSARRLCMTVISLVHAG